MATPAPATRNLVSLQKRAKDLLTLARDSSDHARAELAAGLYELSHESAALPNGEATLAVDTLLQILERAVTSVRRQVAERLARDPAAPKPLVMALAHDEISVAFPVLVESNALAESDLLEIIRNSPHEHRLGTLQREAVTEKMAEAVVETGDPHVMRWLIENPAAKIPRHALEVILETARVEPVLQEPLAHRSDLPPDLAAKLQSFIPAELRDAAQSSAPPAGDAGGGGGPAGAEADQRALKQALDLRSSGALNVDLLVKTVRAGKMTEFEALFARFSHISLAAARQILASPTGEALAVALKAQGVAKGTFATTFILTRKARDPNADLAAALGRASDVYDRMTTADAKKRFAALQAAHPEDPPA